MAAALDQTRAPAAQAPRDADMRDDLDRLTDVETLIRDVALLATREVKGAVAAVERAAEQIEERAHQPADHARRAVRKNPLGACAAAAGAGFMAAKRPDHLTRTVERLSRSFGGGD